MTPIPAKIFVGGRTFQVYINFPDEDVSLATFPTMAVVEKAIQNDTEDRVVELDINTRLIVRMATP